MPTGARETAQALVDAWRTGDKEQAGHVATQEVVDKLFSHEFPIPPPSLTQCDRVATSESDCVFSVSGGSLILRVADHGGSFIVERAEFLAY